MCVCARSRVRAHTFVDLEDMALKGESTKTRRRVLFVGRSWKLWTKLRMGNAAVTSETRPSGIKWLSGFHLQ